MQQPEQSLRTFARRVQQVANLAAAAPGADSLADNVRELQGEANVLLERAPEKLIRAQLEGLRDTLHQLWTKLGGRLLGKPARQPSLKGVPETAGVLESLARDLIANLDDKASSDSFRELSDQIAEEGKKKSRQQAIEQAFSRVDAAVQNCIWQGGLRETEFEPFRLDDTYDTWFARLKPQFKKLATWLVEGHFAPLARELHKAAPVLGDASEMIEIDIPASLAPARAKPRVFMRDTVRELVAGVEDAKVRRRVAKRLGDALTQNPDRVPSLFFLEYFEVLRGNVETRGKAAIAALRAPRPESHAAGEPRSPTVESAPPPEQASGTVVPEQIVLGIRHGRDFSSLQAGGTTYHFTTPLQRAVIAVLFTEWKRGVGVDGCGLTVAALSEAIAEDRKTRRERLRVDRLFKGHPALGTILRKNGKSVWALHLRGPEKAQS